MITRMNITILMYAGIEVPGLHLSLITPGGAGVDGININNYISSINVIAPLLE